MLVTNLNAPEKGATSKSIPVELVQFLVVDDHAPVRRIVAECLKANGVKRVTHASDGQQALNMLNFGSSFVQRASFAELIAARPDIANDLFPETKDLKAAHARCVVTDFNMPPMNGLELLKAIRCGRTNVPRNTPVVMLTGFAEDFVVETALQLDVSAFAIKPVSKIDLWEKIERALRSNIFPKNVDIYRRVEIPNELGEYESMKAPIAPAPNPNIVSDNNIREIQLAAIQPGAVLACDLTGTNGNLLLRAGSEFTKGVLQKILEVHKIKGCKGTAFIKCDAPESDQSDGAKIDDKAMN